MNIYTEELEKKIKDFLEENGYELYRFQVVPLKKRMLVRVFIDKEDGVSIDDCARVSRELDEIFFVAGTFESSFTLEVSSPGLKRPLTELKQYKKNIGRKIKVQYQVEGKTRYNTVRLLEASEDGIKVDPEKKKKEKFTIPFERIEKANVVPEFR